MIDTSFLYFAKDNIIDKIDIDPILIDSFKRVMKTMQEYFNANGYTLDRNYKEYIQKYLLSTDGKKFKFIVDYISNPNWVGVYRKNKNEICISNKVIYDKDELDSTICHEFIHFLVMHGIDKNSGEAEIVNGGFINEALTEMLTQQMYPKSNAYLPQVSMQKYANLLSGNVNNYHRFLKGFVDARYASSEWLNYLSYANEFQNEYNEKGYINFFDAKNNKNYINAQRKLIDLFIKPNSKKTFDEYVDCIEKLLDRPVPDDEYISKVIESLDNTIIRSIGINNSNYETFFKEKLIEVRKSISEKHQFSGKKIYKFEVGGRKMAIDNNRNFYGELNLVNRFWSPAERKYTISINNDKKELYFDKIDFNEFNININKKINEISQFFTSTLKTDLNMIDSVASSQNFIRVEKFTLPVIGFKRNKPIEIYVAITNEGVKLLNNYIYLENKENVEKLQFLGMSSNDPKTAAIYCNNIGVINNGKSFASISSKTLNNKAISEFMNSQDNLDMDQIVSKYSEFVTDLEDEKDIREECIYLYAKDEFSKLPLEEKKTYYDKVLNDADKFIISCENGNLDVSLLFTDKVAYEGKRQVLLDKEGIGLYNQLYEQTLIEKKNHTL